MIPYHRLPWPVPYDKQSFSLPGEKEQQQQQEEAEEGGGGKIIEEEEKLPVHIRTSAGRVRWERTSTRGVYAYKGKPCTWPRDVRFVVGLHDVMGVRRDGVSFSLSNDCMLSLAINGTTYITPSANYLFTHNMWIHDEHVPNGLTIRLHLPNEDASFPVALETPCTPYVGSVPERAVYPCWTAGSVGPDVWIGDGPQLSCLSRIDYHADHFAHASTWDGDGVPFSYYQIQPRYVTL